MKKIKITYVSIALLLGGAVFLPAESHMDKSMPGKHMQTARSGMCDWCKMHDNKMMHANQGMGGKMMGRQVVPTEDGGIVIVMGPYLLKYDADLNLVKKTEIDLGPDDMQKMMARQKAMQEMMSSSEDKDKKKSE